MAHFDLPPRYEIIRELGSGGMGRVLLVRDAYLLEELALKLLHEPPDPDDLEQVKREFALLAEIEHPGIARAYDFGYAADRPFFTREYVPGELLRPSGVNGNPDAFLKAAWGIADAVAFLHRGGILHLDIKPRNIIVPEDRERPPVLIDFGLCRRGLPAAAGPKLRGSLPYMAPEYFRGQPLGPWTDVYAIGVTLYQVATGHYPRSPPGGMTTPPGDGSTTMDASWDPVPLPPSRFVPALAGDADSLILKCLALDPAARFPSAGELLRAIERLLGAMLPPTTHLGPLLTSQAGLPPTNHAELCPTNHTEPSPTNHPWPSPTNHPWPSPTNHPRPPGTSRVTRPGPRTIGRDTELGAIDRFLEKLAAGRERREPGPAFLFMTGPPGMGQTHLLRELKLRAQMRGHRCYLETGYEGRLPAPGALLRSLGPHLQARARRRWEAFLSRLRRPRKPSHGESSEAELRLRRAAEVAHALSSLREPLVLAIDSLQLFDEISVDLLVQLAHVLVEKPEPVGPRMAVAVSYREEGPTVRFLRELTGCLLEGGRSVVIPLLPLGPREAAKLYHERRSEVKGEAAHLDQEPEGLDVFQKTSGIPSNIVQLAAGIPERRRFAELGPPRSSVRTSVSRDDRKLLLTLTLLLEPKTVAEIARLLKARRGRVAGQLRRLKKAAFVREDDALSTPGRWLAAPAAENLLLGASPGERRRIHAVIARELFREAPADDDPRLVEAVLHARAGGQKTLFVQHGLRLAGYLKSTYQNRSALDLLERVYDALPTTRLLARIQLALEIAELQSRVGELEQGISLLRGLLARSRGIRDRCRPRLLLRLAMLHSRRGDFQQAESLFGEGLRGGHGGQKGARLGLEEFLFFLNEHAAMKTFVGEYGEATRLCEEGLRLAAGRRDARARDLLLNLYATRANIALRNFQFEKAISDFELALRMAESAGSLVNRAVVLNNLGIVYSQCDRCREAIESFHAAEAVCLQLDEGPSLTFVYGNLGLLYSKTGNFDAMERAFAAAKKLTTGAGAARATSGKVDIGRREELFHEHHRGVALINRGRYGEARAHIEAAIRLGTAMGDSFVTAFDEVYRAEALLFEGAYAEAARELRRISRSASLKRLRLMATSRHALLFALTAQGKELARAAREHSLLEAECAVPFLDAWDDIFLGWAFSLGDLHDRAMDRLQRAEDYFRRNGLRPAAALATWALAEAHFLRGDAGAASDLLQALTPASDLTAALKPLLAGRLLLERASAPRERQRAADFLAEAGAALVQNRLPEWTQRLEALRAAFQPEGEGLAKVERQRRELARGLPEEAREAFLHCEHWKSWTEKFDVTQVRRSLSDPFAPSPRATANATAADPGGAATTSRTVALRGAGSQAAHAGIVARSRAMRSVLCALDRMRDSELPVVICGETGTGKELVARVLHTESPRFAGPFRVLDCATIPAGLLDVELFGAREGAFTDLKKDRPGLLAQAAGGTLLVDGLAGASSELQARLLRVLAEGSFRPVGADAETRAEVRFLFSTLRDLEDERREGRLREDLLHRIRVFTLEVPPLRERWEDFEDLVQVFLRSGEGQGPGLERGFVDHLRELEWPGNVRELKNLIVRLRFEHPQFIPVEAIRSASLPPRAAMLIPPPLLAKESLVELKDRVEREYILHHFRSLRGDMQALSRLLGISLQHCYRRLKQLGIEIKEERTRGAGER